MKVVAFNGSPRPKGNTYHLLKALLKVLENKGVETELVQLPKLNLQPCHACYKCAKAKNKKCMGKNNEGLNVAVEKMIEADGIVIGTPTHFANVSGHVKNLIDRAGLVARFNDHLLRRKVGAAVVAVRRAGAIPAFDGINRFFQINGMVVPGSIYWGVGFGLNPGDSENDEEGQRTMADLASNMAWLIKKLKS